MIENIDQQLFLLINSHNSPLWDSIMYAISGRLIWVPLYLAILLTLWFRYRRKMLVIILLIAVAITFSDQVSVLIKLSVQRLRPCHEPALEGLVHLVNEKCGGAYGFVSSHASNSFTIAFLSLLLIRRRWFTVSIILWAIIIAYSRIYLGVHYPGDVVAGSLLGIGTGWSIILLYIYIDKKLLAGTRYFNRQ